MKLFSRGRQGLLLRMLQIQKHKTILVNSGYLTLLKGLESVFPLISVPYLTRILGVEKFGLLAFAGATVVYAAIIINFGFELSATRNISIHRDDPKKTSVIFWSVYFNQLFLTIVALGILLLLFLAFPLFKNAYLIYLLAFCSVVTRAMFPVWFFQGMEKMQFITLFRTFAEIFYLILLFTLVKDANDYLLVPGIHAAEGAMVGVISIIYIILRFKLVFILPKWTDITSLFRESYHIFLTQSFVSIYSMSNILILGLLTNNTITGYYAGAEKIFKALQGVVDPLGRALFPHIAFLFHESPQKGMAFVKKVIFLFSGINIILATLTFFLASHIVAFLLGNEFQESVIILKIFAFLLIPSGLIYIFGAFIMIPMGMQKELNKVVMSVSLFHILLIVILIKLEHVGVAWAFFISETLLSILLAISIYRKKDLLEKK